jgi:hypothetical protein
MMVSHPHIQRHFMVPPSPWGISSGGGSAISGNSNVRRKNNPPPHRHCPSRHGGTTNNISTTVDAEDPSDYVLTPSLMQQLQRCFPMSKRGDSFFLQYSMVRDGANLQKLVEQCQHDTKYSVLAIETLEGEVFGAFVSQPWRRSHQWYGGGESFLWTTTDTQSSTAAKRGDNRTNNKEMDHAKDWSINSIAAVVEYYNDRSNSNYNIEENEDEQEPRTLQIFPYSFANPYIQLCDMERLLIGGGNGDELDHHHGFGIALDRDLLSGSSHPCRTFNSPGLSQIHADGSPFEVRNVEVWNLTPCLSMVETQGRRIVHRRRSRKPHPSTATKKNDNRSLRQKRQDDPGPPQMVFSVDENEMILFDDAFGLGSCTW